MRDLIDRQQAIKAMSETLNRVFPEHRRIAEKCLNAVPSAKPEPAIPLSWIEDHIEWLKSLDNAFSSLAAAQIFIMVKTWKEEKNEDSY